MKEIAKNLCWLLTDNQPLTCATCTAGKAKQKSPKKVRFLDPDDEKDGYCTHLDISTVKKNQNYPVTPNHNFENDCSGNSTTVEVLTLLQVKGHNGRANT